MGVKVECADKERVETSVGDHVQAHVDKENECAVVQPKLMSPRRVTLQPVIEQKIDSSDSDVVVIPDSVQVHSDAVGKRVDDTEASKQSTPEETGSDVPERVGHETEKTVLNAVDMEVETGDTTMTDAATDNASPEDSDVNASSMEITTMSPKVSSETSEARSSVCGPTPMDITLCAER